MNYFAEHNKKQTESLERFNKKVRLLNFQKAKEEQEVNEIIRNRKKERLEYIQNKGTGIALDGFYDKYTFKLYSELTEQEKDKYTEFGMEMKKHI